MKKMADKITFSHFLAILTFLRYCTALALDKLTHFRENYFAVYLHVIIVFICYLFLHLTNEITLMGNATAMK